MRLLLIFIGMAFLVLGTWALWGEGFDESFGFEATVGWMKAHPGWGGFAGMGLLVSDLLLPIPGTVVMSALGYVYGWLVGGMLASLGSIGAGLAGYGVGRLLPERMARRLVGDRDFEKGRRMFEGGGGWVIALSRALPVLPEALSCTAGLVRMPFGRFLLAVACGSLPTGFLFAGIGAAGVAAPGWAMAFSLVVPAVLWLGARGFTQTRRC